MFSNYGCAFYMIFLEKTRTWAIKFCSFSHVSIFINLSLSELKKKEALKLNNKIKFLQFRGSMILRMRSWIIWRIDFCVIRIKSKLETLYCTRINVFEDLFHFYLEPYELLISSYSISISNNSARSERKIPLSDDLHSDADPVAFRASLSFVMYHFYECK